MTKFYIHIGTHKTGTTSIQKTLQSHENDLNKEGISFLYKPTAFLRLAGVQIIEKKYIEKGNRELDEWISSGLRNGINVFVSSHEDLSGGWRIGYKNSHMVAKNLQMMVQDLGLDVEIIVYLRRQDSFIESMYTQSVQSGNPNSFSDFLSSFDDNSFNWYKLVSDYTECFGKDRVIVQTYEKNRLPRSESILHEFGELIGSEFLQSYINLKPQNQGYSRDALEIAKLTTSYISREENEHMRNIFQRINAKQPFENYTYFKPEDRRAFLSKYEESNRKLALEFYNRESLFDNSDLDKRDLQVYPGLTLETATITLTKALIVLSQENEKIKKELMEEKKPALKSRIKRLIKNRLKRFF